MKMRICYANLFLLSFLIGQDTLTHIIKTYPDGTPKEVIIYERANDDLKSDNPFKVLDKMSYDSKGSFIRPKLTGEAKKVERMIIGSWEIDDERDIYLTFKRNGTAEIYIDGEMDEDERLVWFISQDGDDIIFNAKESHEKSYQKSIIVFINNNQFIVDGEITLNRKK
ncbi:MAG: hypothetical protein QF757_01240 [Candidatus Marinimicrobia bacterium]|jgi:hypothetical protein|nr:hypothetical protein [Candidatus Neomarinimicrobiota bacterium]|tara:strand:+ start:89 stop:592 length:504 start_codon:yes stop_codon:yes gene_type:complete